jgi:hypothetical protein
MCNPVVKKNDDKLNSWSPILLWMLKSNRSGDISFPTKTAKQPYGNKV